MNARRWVTALAVVAVMVTGIAPPSPPLAEGGSLMCVLTGLLFGAAVMTGNVVAAAGAVVAAVGNGCF